MSVTQWISELQSSDMQERVAACQALASTADEARAAAVALIDLLGDESCCEWAESALEQLGPPELTALGDLCTRLHSPLEVQAYWSATLLGRLGHAGESAVSALCECARRGPLSAQQRAVWALGKIGRRSQEVSDLARELVGSDDPRLARLAGVLLSDE